MSAGLVIGGKDVAYEKEKVIGASSGYTGVPAADVLQE